MGEKAVTNSERAMGGSFVRLVEPCFRAARKAAQLAAAAALLCVISQNLYASEPTIATGPMIQRSTRVVPRHYIIKPSEATIATDQTQRFGVVDANGNPVVVRWNVSGLGCYGASCGSVDEEGVYHPPATLPKPGVVTLEGVVVADPHYSVLTQIRLQAPASATPAVAAVAKPQLAAPALPNGSRAESMPLQGAVVAAPAETANKTMRGAEIVPLPTVVAATPTVESRSAPRTSNLPPVPVAVAATPKVGTLESARAEKLIPVPSGIAAAPPIADGKVASRPASLPLPAAVASAPTITPGSSGRESRGKKKEEPLALMVGAAPIMSNQKESRPRDPNPPSAATAPVARSPQPSTVPAAIATTASTVSAQAPALRVPVMEKPATTQPTVIAEIQPNPALRPRTDAPTQPTDVKADQSPGQPPMKVTYRGGLLTIDARNASLAEVLKLVSEKTGAKIELPPGTGQERIVEHAGPGMPNDVLTQLLNGSQFNFIIVNSQQRPQELAEVLLSVRPAESGNVVAQSLTPTPSLAPNPSTPTWQYKPPQPTTSATTLPLPPYEDIHPPEGLSGQAAGDFIREKFLEVLQKNAQQNQQQ